MHPLYQFASRKPKDGRASVFPRQIRAETWRIPTSPVVAADLVLAARTVAVAVAHPRSRDADVAVVAPEGLCRADRAAALLVGAVGAVGTAVADEEPADAAPGRSALERAGRAAGPTRAATAVPQEVAVADAADAARQRVGHSALQVGDAGQAKTDRRHYRALVPIRLDRR